MIKRFMPFFLMLCLLAAGACAGKSGRQHATDEYGNIIYMDAPAEEDEDGKLLEESISFKEIGNILLSEREKAALNSSYTPLFDLSDQDREEVEAHFILFTHKARDRFEKWLERSQYYLPYMKQVFNERGLPEELIYLPFVESGYNPKVTSSAGARGMWQFMPSTGRIYGLQNDWWVDERRDPYKSAHAAADYLTKLYGMFGDWYLALAAYNAGEGKIQRALIASGCETFFDLSKKNDQLCGRGTKLQLETQHYVPRFLAVLKIVRNLESLGFQPLNWNLAPDLIHLQVPGGTDLKALAHSASMNWEEFYSFNMAFRRYVSPPGRTSVVYLPRQNQAAAEEYLNNPAKVSPSGYTIYMARKGDTLPQISKRTGIPVDALLGVNAGLSLNKTLAGGDTVRLPSGSLVAEERVTASASGGKRGGSAKSAQAKGKPNYTVKSGDTIFSLARRYNISQEQLISMNGLTGKNKMLKAGGRLYIPALAVSGKAPAKGKTTGNKQVASSGKSAAPAAKKPAASKGKTQAKTGKAAPYKSASSSNTAKKSTTAEADKKNGQRKL